MKMVLLLAVATVLALVVATVVVGSKVREETVVARPYEDGLRQDAERAARAALGLAVRVDDEAPRAGAGPLVFRLSDRQGRPLERARVTVELSRPATSRGEVRAEARETAPGRYEAELTFPSAGPWDVRFDVLVGADRVRLERRLRPLRTMRELAVRAVVRRPDPPELRWRSWDPPLEVAVAFSMPGMEMGTNRVALAATRDGFAGTAVLVRCPSGRRAWVADVTVAVRGAAPRTARFPLTVAE